MGKSLLASEIGEVARSGVVGAGRCCWVRGPDSANDTMFGDAGYPDKGPLGLWVPCHPGIKNLSSLESGSTPKYELRFRHPDLPISTHTLIYRTLTGSLLCVLHACRIYLECYQAAFRVPLGLYRLSPAQWSVMF